MQGRGRASRSFGFNHRISGEVLWPERIYRSGKDPLLADFLADLYCKGTELAAIRQAGPDATKDQMGEAMDTIKDRIRDFIKTGED